MISRCFTEWLDINCCVKESISIAADMNNKQACLSPADQHRALTHSGGCEYWQQAFYTPYWLDWLIKTNFISQMKRHAWQSLHERDAFDLKEAEQISLRMCVQCTSTVYKRLAAALSVWNSHDKFMFICRLLRADSVSLSLGNTFLLNN